MQNTSAGIIITVDHTSVPMGRTICVTANMSGVDGVLHSNYILLPIVNGRRWGAHERPDTGGHAVFLLPLPNPGPASIQVVAYKSDTDHWMGLEQHKDLLLAGYPMPQDGVAK